MKAKRILDVWQMLRKPTVPLCFYVTEAFCIATFYSHIATSSHTTHHANNKTLEKRHSTCATWSSVSITPPYTNPATAAGAW